MRSSLLAVLALAVLGIVAVYQGQAVADKEGWTEVRPGVFRSAGEPASYALVEDGKALLIDAATPPEKVPAKSVEMVLLTHAHRDTARYAAAFRKAGATVRASKVADEWLTPERLAKHWKDSLPLRGSRTYYLALPEGVPGVDASLVDGAKLEWRGWNIEVVATPGHSMDHISFVGRKGERGPKLLFSGDAVGTDGTLWTPYTTDWDHWTDAGLTPAAKSLAKLREVKADVLLPARGTVVDKGIEALLAKTQANAEEMAFLKSFERFTKERLKDAPQYAFLAKEQATSNGSKPWTRVSEHLWLTGNTYVLTSKDGVCLVVDPWDPHSAKQLPKLQEDQKVGPIEVAFCSHAHFDHYDGAYSLLEREKNCKVWTLDRVAEPLEAPFLTRAPFLDARPLKIDRKFRDGEQGTWREYTFRFHFLPGQTEYTMGVECVIDGKRCYFTADNWFHQDQFSGSGGWMGLNRSFPGPYAESAAKVLAAKPEWVLAEHGGPFEFVAEDWRRRVEWGKAGAKAADALSPSGDHRHDWNPHRVRIEPIRVTAKPGQEITLTLAADNILDRPRTLSAVLEGGRITDDRSWTLDLARGQRGKKTPFTIRVKEGVPAGRYPLPLWVREGDRDEGSDGFVVVDVE
jgi:glyoxylase-like metal-dependent hydrolase (beta-lactamase superfamily II)